MIKTIVIIFLLNIITRNIINAAYAAQKCYICHNNSCEHPSKDDIQSCSDSANSAGTDGQEFVNGAFGTSGNPYKTFEDRMKDFATTEQSVNDTNMPSWESLTRWVCYVSKDKTRGCLIMGNGLCEKDKSILSKLTEIGSKLTDIIDKARKNVGSMFSSVPNSKDLTEDQKSNISHWMVTNYMVGLINNTKEDKYRLDTCCEGDACNFASMIEKSTIVFIVLLISTFILV